MNAAGRFWLSYALALALLALLAGCSTTTTSAAPFPGAVCDLDGTGPVRVVSELDAQTARPGWWAVQSSTGPDWWIASAASLRGCR